MSGQRFQLRAPEVALETFDGEAIVIDFTSGSYYSLSASASEVVVALAAGQSADELTMDLAARYPDAGAELREHVDGVLTRLRTDGVLVEREDLSATSAKAPEPAAGGTPPVGSAPVGSAPACSAPVCGAPAGSWQAPVIERFEDMQEMLLLDPIHEVDLQGWPAQPPGETTPADGSSTLVQPPGDEQPTA